MESWRLPEIPTPEGTRSPVVLKSEDEARAVLIALDPGQSLGDHQVKEHAWLLVVEGTARARVEGGADLELMPGDIVVFPHGDPHHLSAGPGTNPVESAAVLQRITTGDLSPMQAGGGGAITRFVCGYLTLDPLLCGPILESLPPILKVNVRTDRAGHWLEQSILHLLEEATSNRAGSDAMLSKLSEALFVETVRRHVAGLPDQSTGWLAGARDPVVGRSLALLHKRPEHPWTVAELAAAVGVSRSALVARFTRYLADPPMAYLTGWRLRLAAQALTSSSRGVADVAAAVGYESEAAFNRAFKRVFGVPPAQYRRQTRKAASLDRAQLPATVSPPTR